MAINKHILYWEWSIYILCTNNSILARPNKDELIAIIEDTKYIKLDIIILRDLKDFVGINIQREVDGILYMS